MKIAILGISAVTHLIAKKLLEDSNVTTVYHISGNPGIQTTGRYIPLTLNTDQILDFLDTTELTFIFLTTISFLCNERIQNKIKEKNIPSCSPDHNLSLLEWSKFQGKELLIKLNIPTAGSRSIPKKTLFEKFFSIPRPWVLKFERDYRSGGQTVIITDENVDEEFNNLQLFGQTRYSKNFAGEFIDQHFLVEEFIKGSKEYSYHILSNGSEWEYIGAARDYKKFFDGDVGKNTSGMGSYSPVNINQKVHSYADKIIKHLNSVGTPYRGILYLGILEDQSGEPHVLEINIRPGDPEFQSILMTLDSNQSLAEMLHKAATRQKLDVIRHNDKHGVSVRIVNSDYFNIVNSIAVGDASLVPHQNPQLWPELPGIHISLNKERKLLNSIITSSANTRQEARDKIYKFLDNVEMYNFTYRKDIGKLE